MYRILMITLALTGMLTVGCFHAVADEAVSLPAESGEKFVYRIEMKQRLLSSMKQDAEELSRIRAQNSMDDRKLSDTRYLTRLEEKLGVLINETLNNTEHTGPPVFRPITPSTLMPESQYDEKGVEAREAASKKG